MVNDGHPRSPREQSLEIRRFILEHVTEHSRDIAAWTAQHFDITRQAVNRHLSILVRSKELQASGSTRSREYKRSAQSKNSRDDRLSFNVPLFPELHEDRVWTESVNPFLKSIKDNVRKTCSYGFTEMLNNAIDHSSGTEARIQVERGGDVIRIMIDDDGIGIFRKIREHFNLEDERHAIFELTKGKLTTDPRRHTGEGIFFTSRAFDEFSIESGKLLMSCRSGKDWLLDSKTRHEGTKISMTISKDSERNLSEVFDRYTSGDEDYGFDRTIIAVALVEYGEENLISRSQAKRLLARVDRFREVVLDFTGVESIGQAFSDEIFRVFHTEHPRTQIDFTNANEAVQKMIRRARAANGPEASDFNSEK